MPITSLQQFHSCIHCIAAEAHLAVGISFIMTGSFLEILNTRPQGLHPSDFQVAGTDWWLGLGR